MENTLEKPMLSWNQIEEPCYLNLPQGEGKKERVWFLLPCQPGFPALHQPGDRVGSCQVRVLFTLNEFPFHLVKLLPTSHCETPWQSNQVPFVHFYPIPLDVFKLDCSRTEGHSEEKWEKYKTGVLIVTLCGAPWSIFISDPVLAVQWGIQQALSITGAQRRSTWQAQ